MKRFYYMMLALMLALLPNAAWAQTAYVVYCQGEESTKQVEVNGETVDSTWYWDATLYFTYRNESLVAGGTFTPAGSSIPRTITAVWSGDDVLDSPKGNEDNTVDMYANRAKWLRSSPCCTDIITKAVIEPSFSSCKPKSLARWFGSSQLPESVLTPSDSHLSNIEGLEYLDTSECTSFRSVFVACRLLTSLDVSTFDTSKVEDMGSTFNRCLNLTTITGLENWNTSHVKNCGTMFQACTSLTDLSGIEDWDMSSVECTTCMIKDCSSLTSLDLSHWDLSGVKGNTRNIIYLTKYYSNGTKALTPLYIPGSMDKMFQGCSSLASLNLSGWNVGGVVNITRMFSDCTSLSELNLSGWDTDNVTNMSRMFRGMTSLTTLNLTGWNTSKVINFAYMFDDCTNLTSIVGLDGFDTSHATYMNYMFRGCSSLTSLDLSNFNTSQVISMQSMFRNCYSLTSLNLSSFDTSNVTSMNYMFFHMGGDMTTLNLSSFDTRNVTDMSAMFTRRNSASAALTTILVGENWSTDAVTTSTNMFLRCTALMGGNGTTFNSANNDASYAHIDVAGNPGYLTGKRPYAVYDAGTHTLYLTNRSEVSTSSFTPEAEGASEITSGLTAVNISEGNYNLATLLSGNGISASGITSVVIEPSFKTVRPTTLASWFSGMTSLATIEGVDNLNTSYVTSMKDLFKNCSSLSGAFLNVGSWKHFDTSNVTDMSGMFQGCSNVSFTTLDLSKFNTASVTTMANMFQGCSSLQYGTYTDAADNTPLDFEHFDTSNVTNFGGMFQDCAALTELTLDNFYTVSAITMAGMFQGCTGMKTLDLSSFYVPNVTTVANMFKGCSSLQTIYTGLTWDVSGAISTDMFAECSTSLTGGCGTKWNSTRATDATLAVLDNDEHIGYLTEKYPLVISFYEDRGNAGVVAAYAGQSGTVTVHRAFTKDAWTTLCLPFDMTYAQVKNIFGEDAELKTLSSVVRSGATIEAVTWKDATSIEAGKPYLIMPSTNITYDKGFTLASKTISAGTPGNVNNMGFVMQGVFTPTTITTSSTENLYTLIDGSGVEPTTLSSNYTTLSGSSDISGLRAYFKSLKNEYVSVKIAASGVSSFSSTYDVDFTGVEGVRAYIGTFYTVENASKGMGDLTISRIYDVPAGTGVLLKGTPSATYNIPISKSKTVVTNLLVGTPSEAVRVHTTDGNYTNYYLSSGAFKLATAGGNNVGVGKCYLSLPTAELWAANPASGTLSAPERFRIIWDDEDTEATAIDEVENAAKANEAVYYNLNGQRVAAPTKGIYIVNGKKVLVK